jgi:hypothetical protein
MPGEERGTSRPRARLRLFLRIWCKADGWQNLRAFQLDPLEIVGVEPKGFQEPEKFLLG